jgi:hypothetical protein
MSATVSDRHVIEVTQDEARFLVATIGMTNGAATPDSRAAADAYLRELLSSGLLDVAALQHKLLPIAGQPKSGATA